jgi:hypothetical protein
MIIDVPECWREALAESGAKLSYETAANVATELKGNIERFAREYAALSEPVWKARYEKAYEASNDYIRDMRKKFEFDPIL